jgi:hypothetical protein
MGMSKSRRYSVIDSIEIAAPPTRVLAALPDELALGVARFSVEARTANGLALACDAKALDCGGTHAWLAVAPMREGTRVAVVHSQLSAKAYEALVDPWRAFLAKLADDTTRDHAA